MRKQLVGLMIVASISASACDQLAWPSKGPAFDQIQVGKTTRAEIFAAMGDTPNRTLYNAAGLEVESLLYEDSRYIYEIKIATTPFTEPTVIFKRLGPKEQLIR